MCEQAFSLEVGVSPVEIDTREMIDSSFDEIGRPSFEAGDWAQIGGILEVSFFRGHRLEALRVTRIDHR